MNLRQSLSTPIPAVFIAAGKLLDAAEKHLNGDYAGAKADLVQADDKEVWIYTNQAWGKDAARRFGFVEVNDAPAHLPLAERPTPRMPNLTTRSAAIARDGHNCRFCGTPVVDPMLRKLVQSRYPRLSAGGPPMRPSTQRFSACGCSLTISCQTAEAEIAHLATS